MRAKNAARIQPAALVANAGKRRQSAPLFPATLRPGKQIVTTTRKVRYWRCASICWKQTLPLAWESKARSLGRESEAQLVPPKSKAWQRERERQRERESSARHRQREPNAPTVLLEATNQKLPIQPRRPQSPLRPSKNWVWKAAGRLLPTPPLTALQPARPCPSFVSPSALLLLLSQPPRVLIAREVPAVSLLISSLYQLPLRVLQALRSRYQLHRKRFSSPASARMGVILQPMHHRQATAEASLLGLPRWRGRWSRTTGARSLWKNGSGT